MTIRLLLLPAAGLLSIAGPADAQPGRRSQLASVGQTVNTARIDIVYRRPVARERELFGQLVPWGRVWSPSADSAAIFTVSAPIEVAGEKLAAGTYSVWAIPEKEEWTIIFNSTARAFHLTHSSGSDVLRVKAVPVESDHMETLAFYFPMVDADSAYLRLQWGKTVVPLTIRAR
jgi:hypothetical protein